MKSPSLTLLMILISTWVLTAQEIRFTYDASGNRTVREASAEEKDAFHDPGLVPGNCSEVKTSKDYKVTFFPNPAGERIQVNIDTPFSIRNSRLTLTSVSGLVLLQKNEISNQLELPLYQLESGLYFIIIQTDEFFSTSKLIKK